MNLQRALALILAAAVAAVAVLERRSPLFQAASAHKPWVSWLTLAGGPEQDTPFLYLQVYDPLRRKLDLVYLPDTTKGLGADASAWAAVLPPTEGWDWSALPVIRERTALPGDVEPAVWAKTWLRRSLASPRTWLEFKSFDRLKLALELSRLRPQDIRPAWLPEEGQRAMFLQDILSPRVDAAERGAITVEVFNGSGQAGLASQAKKVLRLKGADVVTTGNSDLLEASTVVYDRTGRHEDAQAVRAMLGCEAALAVTQVDPKRLVDVSVLLADDCPLQ